MRIALVTRVWPTQRPGGMPHVARDRAVELARQGHDVHVITTSGTRTAGHIGLATETLEEGVTVHYTSSPGHEWSGPFADCCKAEVDRLQPEIVHLESFDRERLWWATLHEPLVAITMHGFHLGAWLSSWNGHRALGWKEEPFPHAKIKQEAAALAYADVVIGTSRWEYRLLRDQYGLSNARRVYDPIHECFFTTPARGGERTYFLAAAISGDRMRGFDRAQAAAAAAGVTIQVIKGARRQAMPQYYDGAIALVLPTQYAQGFDLTIGEARARGCPAIMTATGSYLDEAEPWDVLVPLGEPRPLISALVTLVAGQGPARSHLITGDRHRPEEHVRAWLAALD